ncbi:uncharacterized protein PFL1_04206 [Pseudozyma flocculosa PF-1]|uniref:Uncharacterized protein n=2 Tax=Pseudozyma flocculosa TaxID=84751 RepID=A0A5C3ET57_9BASI|nr:uncharacterized protein PFL1_04206 [Pseudozyma flocculosa PF-1]EPQ28379.1 hypothetical protein PFL1_04206 [Pseudozyma flocculosa PF-1]SPO35533.1 uncharacterized protein PSFLO_01004 [Pseudozyma flocculosa]
MFKPTPSLCSKASRLPLTSKKGNRDFFKGTRTGNIMRRKRIATSDPAGRQLYDKNGRELSWTIKTHRIDEARVPSYIVPPGLAETKLRPYVFIGDASDGGVSSKDKIGMPNYPKMDQHGFDGTYYRSIINEMLQKRRIRERQDEDKRIAEAVRQK